MDRVPYLLKYSFRVLRFDGTNLRQVGRLSSAMLHFRYKTFQSSFHMLPTPTDCAEAFRRHSPTPRRWGHVFIGISEEKTAVNWVQTIQSRVKYEAFVQNMLELMCTRDHSLFHLPIRREKRHGNLKAIPPTLYVVEICIFDASDRLYYFAAESVSYLLLSAEVRRLDHLPDAGGLVPIQYIH